MGFELLTISLETCIWKSFGSVKVQKNCLMGFPMTALYGFKQTYLLGIILILNCATGKILVHLRFVLVSFVF